jgi:phosphoribosylamine--glycine ligase
MGDPETEVVIPRIKSDLFEVFTHVANTTLKDVTLDIDPKTSVTVMLVSGGYPEAYEKGKIITGTEKVDDSIVFHAGTKLDGDTVLTNGGRVISVTSLGDSIQEALETSYKNVELIQFEKKYFRKDIGFDL